jgi:hypothetical protein
LVKRRVIEETFEDETLDVVEDELDGDDEAANEDEEGGEEEAEPVRAALSGAKKSRARAR